MTRTEVACSPTPATWIRASAAPVATNRACGQASLTASSAPSARQKSAPKTSSDTRTTRRRTLTPFKVRDPPVVFKADYTLGQDRWSGDAAGADVIRRRPAGRQAVHPDEGARVGSVHELAAADVEADVAEAVEEHEVAGLQLVIGNGYPVVPHRIRGVRQRDP